VVRALDFVFGGPGSIPRTGCHVMPLGKTLCFVFSDKDVKLEVPSAFTLTMLQGGRIKEPMRTKTNLWQ